MHTLMDNRIKNIESFDFLKLNNNHPKNAKAVDLIRKTILWKMKLDGKYGKEKQLNKNKEKGHCIINRVSSPDIWREYNNNA